VKGPVVTWCVLVTGTKSGLGYLRIWVQHPRRVKGCRQASRQHNVQQTAELEAKNLEPKNKQTKTHSTQAYFDYNQDL